MDDLISRRAAVLAIRRTAEPFYRGEDNIIPAEYEDAIMKLPTIDPVNHGKWTEQKVTHEDNRRSTIIADWQSAKCSNCGKYHTTPYLYYFNYYNYCPRCGAKMDDDRKEPEINPCRGCDDYDGRGGCKSYGGCGG